MRHITNTSKRQGGYDVEAAAFWILGAIIMVIAFGDALAVLASAVAIVAVMSWIYRKVEQRLERREAAIAPVTHLRPELTGQAHPAHRAPRAA
jgi:hypothetical protein